MTEEKIERKAEEYADGFSFAGYDARPEDIAEAYKDGYEQAQKDLFEWTDREQLLKQIEKMKCCGNCKYESEHLYIDGTEQHCRECENKNKWELAE